MSIPVLIIGRSGSGKTYSLKGFADTPKAIGVISVEKGRLPFKSEIKTLKVKKEYSPDVLKQIIENLGGEYKGNQIETYRQINAAKYAWIMSIIKNAEAKSIVIDDSQYLLVNELFDRTGERGYDKFTDMAANFRNLVHFINELDDDNKIVYFFHHSELDTDGREKTKTIGKMLDEKLTIEGCFDIVIYCQDHEFYTQSNNQSTAKSPEGMFDLKIPNNLKLVDDKIREYYGLGGGNEERPS